MHHIKCSPGDIARRVIVCGDPNRTRRAAELLSDARLVNDYRALLTYTGDYGGVPVTVSTTGMGAPSAAIVMEELAMLGAKEVVRVGTTGGIADSVRIGDVIVPSKAIPLDGATRSYMGRRTAQPSDAAISRLLCKEAEGRGLKAHRGTICTSDTFYLEEEKGAKAWAAKGILSFEMECSVIFALGRLRGYRAAAILTVTGKIEGTDDRVLDPQSTADSVERSLLCAFGALSKLQA